MLSKRNRLLKKKDFDAVWQKGRSSFDKVLGVKAISGGGEQNRFGILVGLKVSKKAVERNKIKRRLREVIAAETRNLKVGFDIVITALPAANAKEYKELRDSLLGHLDRLSIVKK